MESRFPHNLSSVGHQALAMPDYNKQETASREHKKVEIEERRFKMQQIKDELPIGETEGFDNALLDVKRQEKFLEDIKQQKKEANVTYLESQQSVSESQSRVSGYEHHQQPHRKQQISHQDPRAQYIYPEDTHSPGRTQQGMGQQEMRQQSVSQQRMGQQGMGCQSMGQQGMGQQRIYPQSAPQQSTYLHLQDTLSQDVFQQSVHQHGMLQQDLHSQHVYQQEWSHQGVYPQQVHNSQEMLQQELPQLDIHSQSLNSQGINNSNMPQPGTYQRSAPQNYQSQHHNLLPSNGNWQSENPMTRHEFHQILRAETNIPNNNYKPYRQTDVSHNTPQLEVGDAVQSGINPASYGTIKWIGELSGFHELIAGVEMVKKLCAIVLINM